MSVTSPASSSVNTADVNVTVVSAGVSLVVTGGTGTRQIGSLTTLILDASATVDLDYITTDSFLFTWTCEALDSNGT